MAFISESQLVWGDERGNVTSYDLARKKWGWKLKQGARVTDMLASTQRLVVTSLDNFVYMLDPATGFVRWKKRLEGQPNKISALDDAQIAVSEASGSTITILATSNGRTIEVVDRDPESGFAIVSAVSGDSLFVSTPIGLYCYRMAGLTEKAARSLLTGAASQISFG
jgi:outer membrane protein assembly factor BamB